MLVRLGINCDRWDAKLLAGADNAKSDFTAIGNQNLSEHGGDARLFSRADGEELLPELYGAIVLHVDPHNLPGNIGRYLIHQFHRFYDAKDRALLHGGADLNERIGAGSGRAIERTDNRRGDKVKASLLLRVRLRVGLDSRGGRIRDV